MITSHISVKDDVNLSKTCKALAQLVNRIFVELVILPLFSNKQNKLARRLVLKVTSTVDVSVWEGEQYLAMVTRTNLNNLKWLKYNGPSFMADMDCISFSNSYINALQH
jgi:hypothetical protein